METIEKIKQQLAENPIILYMKDPPSYPAAVSLPRPPRP